MNISAACLRKSLVLSFFLWGSYPAFSQVNEDTPSSWDIRRDRGDSNKAYKYLENDGVFVFYHTKDRALYRKLLPEEFDMPTILTIQLFVMDFYKIDSDAEPYKEVSISLLAKHDGKEVWHCIYMPVTSRDSMIAGRVGLGLPKTIGDIKFQRNGSSYTVHIKDNQERSSTITLNIENDAFTQEEEETIKKLVALPKVNLQRGNAIQMGRTGGKGNIIDTSKRFPHLLKIQRGEANLEFDKGRSSTGHPFDLKPSGIIIAYYMHNKIPFRLGRKRF